MRPLLPHITLLALMLSAAGASVHGAPDADSVGGVSRERLMDFWSTYMVDQLHYGEGRVPNRIVGFFGEIDSTGSPANAVLGFLETNGDIFRIDDVGAELVLDTIVTRDDGSRTIVLQQVCQGLSVVGCHLDFGVTPESSIERINGRFLPDVRVSVKPQIDSVTAIGIASDSLKSAGLKADGLTGTLCILPQRDSFRLVWQIDGLRLSDPAHPRESVYVDAHSGEIVSGQY